MTTLWHSATRLTAARHAPEGPCAAPSCDGYAASLASAGSGEHARDVLSTPTARLDVGSSVKAVVTRERRWLVEEWNGPYGAHGESSLQGACGSGRRCSPRPPPGKPSTIPCSPDLDRAWGHQGPLWGAASGLGVRATAYLNYPGQFPLILSLSVNNVPGITALTYSLSVLRYPTDTAHRAVRQSGTLAQPIASRGCPCPRALRGHTAP